MLYRIADFTVEFKNVSEPLIRYLKPYETEGSPEVSFSISNEELAEEKKDYPMINSDSVIELAIYHYKLSEWVPLHNAFFLHAALIDVANTGVAFTAFSGTGKTTHMLLWQKLLGDKLTIVNGDKPFIRFFEGEQYPYAYGTPWNGKEHLGTTGKVPLKHICVIKRGTVNSCVKITPNDMLKEIFKQVHIPRKNTNAAHNAMLLIDRLLSTCTLWEITCNMDIAAAEVAYNTIFKEQSNET